jgi:DNA-binding PadR family transcriptional regulator
MFNWNDHEPGPAFAGAGGWVQGDEWGDVQWGPGPNLPRMLHHFARRFPFGPGAFGPGMGPRMFGRGDLKYGVLAMLEERPKHGYEMIKELEERSGGFYTPSAGAIYPTLQLLEDRGWVTAQTVEGKKVYTISDEGRQALAEQRQRAEERPGPGFGPAEWWRSEWGRPERPHGPPHHPGRPERFPWEARQEIRGLFHQAREVAHLMRQAVMASNGDPEQLQRIQAIVERTRTDLHNYLRERQPGQGGAPGASSPTPPPNDATLI